MDRALGRRGSVDAVFTSWASSNANNLYRIGENSSFNQVDHPENNNKADPFLQNSALNAHPLDPQPMISEAWETLRHSLVNFRGVPVGTIAALDNSEEKLNYDQVKGYFSNFSEGVV